MSKLVAAMYEKQQTKITVGKTAFTQDGSGLSETQKPLTTGQPVTNLHIDQFDAFGSDKQDLITKRDDNVNELDWLSKPTENQRLLYEAAFDDETGSIKMVRANGEEWQITGFLTQSDFGTGAEGPRGEKGLDGFDGDDGYDGACGPEGCAGDTGAEGAIGPMGESGEDGEQGVQGPPGPPGKEGYRGPNGEQGIIGNEGCEGAQGCSGECEGSVGAEGTSPNFGVVVTSDEPSDNTTYIWGVL